jgi:hypothetical protein
LAADSRLLLGRKLFNVGPQPGDLLSRQVKALLGALVA